MQKYKQRSSDLFISTSRKRLKSLSASHSSHIKPRPVRTKVSSLSKENLSRGTWMDIPRPINTPTIKNNEKVKLPNLYSPEPEIAATPTPRRAQGRGLLRRSMPDLPEEIFNNSVARCAYKTRTGSVNGKPKKNNEDAFLIHPYLQGLKSEYLFSVFDGHGSFGHEVSGLLKKFLGKKVEENLPPLSSESSTELMRALKKGVLNTVSIVTNSEIDTEFSGSTLISVLFRNDILVCANIGDSRAVLGKKMGVSWVAVDLSRDHKPDIFDERARINKMKGEVRPFITEYGQFLGPDRVWIENSNIPGLAMSRSIGDKIAHSVGVIDTPEMMTYKLKPEDKFVLLASDGIWEFISSHEAVETIGTSLDHGNSDSCCHSLVKEASVRWQREDQTIDDITLIVVFLNN